VPARAGWSSKLWQRISRRERAPNRAARRRNRVVVAEDADRGVAEAVPEAAAVDAVAVAEGAAGRAAVVAADRVAAGVVLVAGVVVMRARDAATDADRTAAAKAPISSRTSWRSTVWPRSSRAAGASVSMRSWR